VGFNLNQSNVSQVLGGYKFKCVKSQSSQYLVPSIKSDKETLLHLADMRRAASRLFCSQNVETETKTTEKTHQRGRKKVHGSENLTVRKSHKRKLLFHGV